jgi:hypothetical protein
MKLFTIILFCFFLNAHFNVCNAQKFTLNELINLLEKDNNFFDSYAIQKGYKFSSAKGKELRYDFEIGILYNSINILLQRNSTDTTLQKTISWIFKSEGNYLNIKNELSEKLTFFDSGTGENASSTYQYFIYRNKYYEVDLYNEKKSFYKTPIYYVDVKRAN